MRQRALLVGTAGWAERHLMAYRQCRDVEVVGIVGHSDAARLDERADAYGITARFMDLSEAIASTKPDMVDVVASPKFRLPAVRACIGKGVKLVNLEKPMALRPSEAYEIASLCRTNNLLLTVNHQKKLNRPWAHAAEIIRDGRLGDIRFFRATCKGNILEQGTHLVDMVLHFNDYRPVTSVIAQVADLEGFDKPETPAPDSAIASMAFENGVRAEFSMGNNGWDIPHETNKWHHFSVEAFGSKGHLIITLNQSLDVTTYDDGRTTTERSSWDETRLQGLSDHLDSAARYAADPGAGHISSLDNAMKSFEAVMAIYASAAGNSRIALPLRFGDDIIERLRQGH